MQLHPMGRCKAQQGGARESRGRGFIRGGVGGGRRLRLG